MRGIALSPNLGGTITKAVHAPIRAGSSINSALIAGINAANHATGYITCAGNDSAQIIFEIGSTSLPSNAVFVEIRSPPVASPSPQQQRGETILAVHFFNVELLQLD
jgi:hypothetical protein